MADLTLVDSDVILKLFAYQASGFIANEVHSAPAAMLAVAPFVIRKRILDYMPVDDDLDHAAMLEELFDALVRIEPSDDEILLATQLEERAIRNGLDLDVGEAQLLAVLTRRDADFLLTGDKRAVVAIHRLLPDETTHRIVCLEQIMATIVEPISHEHLRSRVCANPKVDLALTACFACASQHVRHEDIIQGLKSYSAALRANSGDCLIPTDAM